MIQDHRNAMPVSKVTNAGMAKELSKKLNEEALRKLASQKEQQDETINITRSDKKPRPFSLHNLLSPIRDRISSQNQTTNECLSNNTMASKKVQESKMYQAKRA